MRSSKSRSRSNKNRNIRPTGGNIINRVFDSSGPDGKVRGTPAQIIEKYNQLHRDAQLSGDRVSAENFAQHAEHYTRILAEAQREIDKVREEQEQFNRERQAERDRQIERDRERQAERQNGKSERQNDQQQNDRQQGERVQNDRSQGDRPQNDRTGGDRPGYDRDRSGRARQQDLPVDDPAMMDQPELPAFLVRGLDMPFSEPADTLMDEVEVSDSGLVETPEAKTRRDEPRPPQARTQSPKAARQPRPEVKDPAPARDEATTVSAEPVEPATEAEAAAPKPKATRARKPKTPKADTAEAAE
jgi:hypothetical protein